MKKILVLFSYLLHPIFIPLIGAFVYLFYTENYLEDLQKYLLIAQVVLITIFIPLTLLFFLKAMGKVDSIMVSEASQRKVPLLIQSLLMVLLLLKSVSYETIPELFYFFVGGILGAVFAFFLLFFSIKVSIHSLAMGSLTTFVMALSLHENVNWTFGIALLILLNGVVMTSRLLMNAHKPKELRWGLFLGVITQLILLRFWL